MKRHVHINTGTHGLGIDGSTLFWIGNKGAKFLADPKNKGEKRAFEREGQVFLMEDLRYLMDKIQKIEKIGKENVEPNFAKKEIVNYDDLAKISV